MLHVTTQSWRGTGWILSLFFIATCITVSCSRKASSDFTEENGTFAERVRITNAINKGDLAELKQCLADGISPHVRGKDDRSTPVHQAAQMHRLEILRLLVQFGGDLNIKDNANNTPLHYAASDGRCYDRNSDKAKTLAYLIANGGDAHAINADGKTPIDLATDDPIAIEIMGGSKLPTP